jgi:vacuolar-type H+-ATPase subunit H
MSQLYESHNDIVSLLPVKIYRHNLAGNYIYSPLHFHRSIELTVTLTGSIRFNSGSKNFDFEESDWLLINSCELHSCRYIAPSDTFTGISILFSLPFIEKWLGKDLFFYNPENPSLTAQIKNISIDIFNMNPDAPAYQFHLMSCIYEILALVSTQCIKKDVSYSVPSKQEVHLASSFADYIEKHYKDIEATLNRAILVAEESTSNIKKAAYDESKVILEDAKRNATKVINNALQKAERIESEAESLRRKVSVYKRRFRTLVEDQLDEMEQFDDRIN